MRTRSLAAAATALLMTGTNVAAQAPGDRANVVYPIVLDANYNAITLDPHANVGEASRLEFTRSVDAGEIHTPSPDDLAIDFLAAMLSSIGIDIPGWLLDFAEGVGDFSNVSLSASLGPFMTLDYGGYFQVDAATASAVNLHYPLQVVNDFPAMNSFKCGDQIAIHTTPQFGADASLRVQPSFYNFELGPVLDNLEVGLKVGLDVSLCVGLQIPEIGCAGYSASFSSGSAEISQEIPLPSLPPLINVCADAFKPGATQATLLACSAGDATAPFFNLAEDILDAYNATHHTNFHFAEFDFADKTITLAPPDLPSAANVPIPDFQGTFHQPGPVTGTGPSPTGKLTASGSEPDLATFSVDLISLVGTILDIPTDYSLGGGLGSIDVGDISPTFHIDQNVRYDFTPTVGTRINLGVPMAYQVVDPVLGTVAAGNGAIVNFNAGQTVLLSFPHALTSPVPMTSSYGMSGDLTTKTSQQYRASVDLAVLKVKGPGLDFTALEAEVPIANDVLPEKTIENHTLHLTNFNSVTPAALTLDPEDPRIDVVTHNVRDVLNLGGGERAVVYRTTVRNTGDVTLSEPELLLDLQRTFGSARDFKAACVTSPDASLNPAYTGKGPNNLLNDTVPLDTGKQGTIDVLVRVTPERSRVGVGGCFAPVSYTSTTFARGISPISTLVRSSFNQCTAQATGPDLLASVDLGASVLSQLSDYAIYAADDVTFDQSAAISYGHVGAGKDVTVRRADATAGLQLVGDVHAGHDVHIDKSNVRVDYAQIAHVLQVDKQSLFNATGGVSERSSCVAELEIPELEFPRPTSGWPRIEVPEGTSQAINPGNYRSVQMRGASTVTLRSGIYNLDELTIQREGGTVLADLSAGPVTLNIDKWRLENGRQFRLVVSGGSTRDLHVNLTGTGDVSFRGAQLQGSFSGPNVGMKLDEGTTLVGSAYARRVVIGSGSSFRSHRFAEPLKIDPVCLPALTAASLQP